MSTKFVILTLSWPDNTINNHEQANISHDWSRKNGLKWIKDDIFQIYTICLSMLSSLIVCMIISWHFRCLNIIFTTHLRFQMLPSQHEKGHAFISHQAGEDIQRQIVAPDYQTCKNIDTFINCNHNNISLYRKENNEISSASPSWRKRVVWLWFHWLSVREMCVIEAFKCYLSLFCHLWYWVMSNSSITWCLSSVDRCGIFY